MVQMYDTFESAKTSILINICVKLTKLQRYSLLGVNLEYNIVKFA